MNTCHKRWPTSYPPRTHTPRDLSNVAQLEPRNSSLSWLMISVFDCNAISHAGMRGGKNSPEEGSGGISLIFYLREMDKMR